MKNDNRTRERKTLSCCKKVLFTSSSAYYPFFFLFLKTDESFYILKITSLISAAKEKNATSDKEIKSEGKNSSENAAVIKGVQVEFLREDALNF